VPTSYTLYTNHIWEDYFITFRHSQNLAEGKGLLYNEGQRVHGFTSPLGVLLPAGCYVITGAQSYEPALWIFRVLSIAAFVTGGVILLLAVPLDQPYARVIQVALALLYVTEAKSVAFSTNGQETAFMLLFVGLGLYLFSRDVSRHWIAHGACWAGLLWTRPDGCIYIAALGLGNLLFTAAPRRDVFKALVKSALVCTVLYLPWFAGAWMYYGSPVPQTVRAKSGLGLDPLRDPEGYLLEVWKRYPVKAAGHFRPIYYGDWDDGWNQQIAPVLDILRRIHCDNLAAHVQQIYSLDLLTLLLALFCSAYWLIPIRDPLGRMASFCFAALTIYFASSVLHVYPWYMPPVALFGIVTLASGWIHLAGAIPRLAPVLRPLAALMLLVLVMERSILLTQMAQQIAVQEEVVEMGNRKVVGEWLKENVRPGERVHLEPVGYIGYFSGAHIVDYPGLVSPEVVYLRKVKGLDRFEFEAVLRPEWMVLRPYEAEWMAKNPFFEKEYEHVKDFDVSDRVERANIPGKGYLRFDARFQVYRRKDLDRAGK
jgi:hypothetical protein